MALLSGGILPEFCQGAFVKIYFAGLRIKIIGCSLFSGFTVININLSTPTYLSTTITLMLPG